MAHTISDTYVLDGRKVWTVEENICEIYVHSDLTLAYLKNLNGNLDYAVDSLKQAMDVLAWVIGKDRIVIQALGRDAYTVIAGNCTHTIYGTFAHSEFVTRLLKHGHQIECEKKWDGDMVLVR